MKQSKRISVSKPVFRAASIVLLIAVFLGLTGCSDQMAKINEQQATLQMMVKANSLQIEEMTARLEKNQKQLNTMVESVQNNVAQVASDLAAVNDAQVRLQKTVQSNSQHVAAQISTLEKSHEDLSVGLGQAISGVQSETRKIAADLTGVAADVTEVTAEQAKLFETVQLGNQDLTNKVTALQESEQEHKNTMGGMEENINALAANISGLGQDVLRLQELLQSNIRELVSIAEVTGQKQVEFQQSVRDGLQTLDDSFISLKANQNNLQTRIEQMQDDVPDLSAMPATLDQLRARLDESLASLKASQNDLQSRIEQIQSDTPDLSDMPAAIDQLREQLEELSRNQMSSDDVGMIEYEASADASLPNGIE